MLERGDATRISESMTARGIYDEGEFAYRTGLPRKSGVGAALRLSRISVPLPFAIRPSEALA
ncbi:glutaminase [Nocardia nepalensis]|uniref:glutaminase n=1 Tax=Nocardia nepalensis TaxID=3375448 RepID=UPI003B678701